MNRFAHVAGFALEHPWALTASMRAVIADLLARRIAGQDADPATVAAALTNRKQLPQPARGGSVAIIPVYGVIAPRMNLMSEMSGGTTFEALSGYLAEAVANPSVKTIVLDVDSPGGSVAGATEFAHELLAARKVKPIIAQSNHLMASAALWLGACATEIVASPSSRVGSIGVFTLHDDMSEALAKLGIKREVFAFGKYKAEGADDGPLSEDARAHIKELISANGERFVADVAEGRGVSTSVVRTSYGEGRCLTAADALGVGMIDRIATLSQTLARLTSTTAPARSSAATDHDRPIAAAVPSHEPLTDVQWGNAATAALLALQF